VTQPPTKPPDARHAPSEPLPRSALLLALLASTAIVLPMLFHGNISGHDFSFHMDSWMDVRGQWREGILFPRWAEWANWGFGEPRFIFYPPLSWMIGAALGSLLPWRMAPGAYVWITLIIACLSMWRFAREVLPSRYANLAAVLYAANPYHLVMVYYRSAFSELLAAALLPLLFWAAIRVIEGEWRQVPTLAIVLAGIWLSGRSKNARARDEERQRLTIRRDRLFAELVRLEHDRRGGKVAQPRYLARREELMAALEHVYGALDSDDMDPGPDRSVAA